MLALPINKPENAVASLDLTLLARHFQKIKHPLKDNDNHCDREGSGSQRMPLPPFCSKFSNNSSIFGCSRVSIVLTDSLKKLLKQTAVQLKGTAKRKFIASTVQSLGLGGQRLAESELGWNRGTIRKGIVGFEVHKLILLTFIY